MALQPNDPHSANPTTADQSSLPSPRPTANYEASARPGRSTPRPENAAALDATSSAAAVGIADPRWCVQGHFDDDRRADRRHQSDRITLRLSLADAVDLGERSTHPHRWVPAALVIRLVQYLDEIHPAITLYRDPTAIDVWVRCTAAEAERLAALLVRAAELAEAPLPAELASDGPFWQDTACPSWCSTRHLPEDAYEDRTHFGDLPSAGETLVDLLLETAAEGRPEQLEVTVAQHYRCTKARVHVIKSEQAEMRLTPVEARTLAGHLLQFVQTAGLPVDTTWPCKPIEGVTVGGEPAFPCPHRHLWCVGHTKTEITEYRHVGNHLLHSGPITSVPYTTAGQPGSIDININSLTDDCTQLFAYVQLLGGDGGAELDVIGIDEAMIALQYTKRFLLQAQPSV